MSKSVSGGRHGHAKPWPWHTRDEAMAARQPNAMPWSAAHKIVWQSRLALDGEGDDKKFFLSLKWLQAKGFLCFLFPQIQ